MSANAPGLPNPSRAAIAAFHAGTLRGAPLMRALATARWQIPAAAKSAGGAAVKRVSWHEDEWHLCLFSDTAAIQAARARIGAGALGDEFLETRGGFVFGHADDQVGFVELDPFSPQSLHFKAPQFAMLRHWADTLRVEDAIDTILQEQRRFAEILAFEGYFIVLAERDGRTRIALAPDDRERALAAVFTAPDAAEAYLAAHPEAGEATEIAGPELFARLAALPLDGFVVNCAGPVAPRGFAKAFADVVIERGGAGDGPAR
jgi:hypothetical protein